MLQDRDVYELVDELCVNNNTILIKHQLGDCVGQTFNLIIRLYNALSEGRDIERAVYI